MPRVYMLRMDIGRMNAARYPFQYRADCPDSLCRLFQLVYFLFTDLVHGLLTSIQILICLELLGCLAGGDVGPQAWGR